MGNLLKKLKSQKGATGTDVIMAATIVVFTIAIVSMIYVNTTLESRNITRTAGATRIATNILENATKMSYAEFVSNYNAAMANTSIVESTTPTANGYKIPGKSGKTLFSTKIPHGYIVYIKADPNYGSKSSNADKFDLVRNIEIIVEYDVGKVTQKVELSKVIKREITGECNAPSPEMLMSQSIVNNEKKYYPIKYLPEQNVYVKTDLKDTEWYSYANKEWARIIVSKKAENTLFDINGKFIGTISTTDNNNYTEMFVWVPKFFVKASSGANNKVFSNFAYGSTKNIQIKFKDLNSVGNASVLKCYTTEKNASTNFFENAGWFGDNEPGKWVGTSKIGTTEWAKALNSSIYGPYSSH